MRAKAIVAIAAAIVVAALSAGAGGAVAAKPTSRHPKPAYKTVKASVRESFTLAGTHGYLIVGTLVNRQRLTLTLLPSRGKGFILTKYSLPAPQPPGSTGIKANLGNLGSIDVHFVVEKSRQEKVAPTSCTGDDPTLKEGRFVGQIHFHGEDGYTRVDVRSAGGEVQIRPKVRCNVSAAEAELDKLLEELGEAGKQEEKKEKAPGEAEGTEPEFHLVKLQAKAQGRPISFKAARLSERNPGKKGNSFTIFDAEAERHRGRIEETSSISLLFGPGSAFKVPDVTHLTQEGVIKPPAPFSGSATYRRESPRSLSWTGDLSVSLPGFGVVPLAGQKFKAATCADSGCHPGE